jgi:hypothetical protein
MKYVGYQHKPVLVIRMQSLDTKAGHWQSLKCFRYWSCESDNDTYAHMYSQRIPPCARNDVLVLRKLFPAYELLDAPTRTARNLYACVRSSSTSRNS